MKDCTKIMVCYNFEYIKRRQNKIMGFIEKLEKKLFEMQDLKYRDFHSRLLPGIDKETIIGIRTPELRKFTKEYAKTPEAEIYKRVCKDSGGRAFYAGVATQIL